MCCQLGCLSCELLQAVTLTEPEESEQQVKNTEISKAKKTDNANNNNYTTVNDEIW